MPQRRILRPPSNSFQLYDQVAEPQELNLSPFVYEVYKQVIVPLAEEKLLNN
jgi:hypothetical protein